MKKFVTIACMLTTLLVASNANAFIVTTSVGTFDISFDETKYDAMGVPELFAMQPWWGSAELAQEFSDAVGNNLGFPNDGGLEGPWFGYDTFDVEGNNSRVSIRFCSNQGGECFTVGGTNSFSTEGLYAFAAPVPIPAAAWLFMSGLIGLVWKGRQAAA